MKKSVKQLEPHEKNPAAVALGLLGAQKGGRARARNLSQAERSASARLAANARWKKAKRKKKAKPG